MSVTNLDSGERQVAPTLAGIRRDHVNRYEWVAKMLPPNSRVLDIACGVGYGASILEKAGHSVVAVDRSADAIAYALQYYPARDGRIDYVCADAESYGPKPEDKDDHSREFDAVISFETIEHLRHPEPIIERWRELAPLLIASVPNEAIFPNIGYKFHYRHYRPFEFKELIECAGYDIEAWHGQSGTESEVEEDNFRARTIIVVAKRSESNVVHINDKKEQGAAQLPIKETPFGAIFGEASPMAKRPVPEHVSIVGLGPSDAAYLDTIKRMGGRHAYCDETWAINAHGAGIDCDLVWHMDDVRVQEIRAAARPDSNIAKMLKWMRKHPGPIMTSRAHPDYPGLVEFPLESVLNKLGYDYFNSTAAYAVAYAIYIGVKKISLWGCDFTYPNSNDAEKGRGCVEYWLGRAMACSINIAIPRTSTLLDAYIPQERRLYGYGTFGSRDATIVEQPDKSVKVQFTEREKLATAEEIEADYDHTKHPASELATVA